MTPSSTPLRILQVAEPAQDGVFRHVKDLCHHLLQSGHRVDLAYSNRRSCSLLEPLLNTIRTAGGYVVNLAVANNPESGDLRALYRLHEAVCRCHPDLIHAHSFKAGFLVRAYGKFQREIPILYTPHAYYGMRTEAGISNLIANTLERFLGNIGTTLNVSEDEARFARETLGLDARGQQVISLGVDSHHFCTPTPLEKEEARRQCGFRTDDVILGTIGRLVPQKDPETLYRAFARVSGSNPKLMLLHLGQGGLEKRLDQLAQRLGISERIRRTAYLADPRVFYHALDAFILTSRYEGLPCTVLEALSCNLPLILSQTSGTGDILALPLSHLWTARPGDDPAFSGAIEAWFEDRARLRPCSHREHVLAQFGFETAFQRLVNAYQCALR
ncbi:MAG: glycosyltransferase family 4 protein [Methylacidiphilales bacterium]|nr:glycosyltransferase family 4 protein [Candidatus Methylacidiphilales bacterium]